MKSSNRGGVREHEEDPVNRQNGPSSEKKLFTREGKAANERERLQWE